MKMRIISIFFTFFLMRPHLHGLKHAPELGVGIILILYDMQLPLEELHFFLMTFNILELIFERLNFFVVLLSEYKFLVADCF